MSKHARRLIDVNSERMQSHFGDNEDDKASAAGSKSEKDKHSGSINFVIFAFSSFITFDTHLNN